jgi:hypothetical protein
MINKSPIQFSLPSISDTAGASGIDCGTRIYKGVYNEHISYDYLEYLEK